MILHRWFTGSDCIRHWITLNVPRYVAPERVAATIACTRTALPFLAAVPLAPLAAAPPAAVYAPAPFVVVGAPAYGVPAYGVGDFVIPGADQGFGAGVPFETAAEGLASYPSKPFLVPEGPLSEGGEVGTGATEGGITPGLPPAVGGSPTSFAPSAAPQPVAEPPSVAVLAVSLLLVWAAGLVGPR